jgi:hypothetical protein
MVAGSNPARGAKRICATPILRNAYSTPWRDAGRRHAPLIGSIQTGLKPSGNAFDPRPQQRHSEKQLWRATVGEQKQPKGENRQRIRHQPEKDIQ